MAPVVTPDCIIDAVLNPDVAGPIKAKGAIKHPDNDTPIANIKSNLLIIESPNVVASLSFLYIKKKKQIDNFNST